MIKNHIQETTSELTSKLNAMNDTFMKRREVTAAKAQLYDVCFEEAINYAMTSENPNDSYYFMTFHARSLEASIYFFSRNQ